MSNKNSGFSNVRARNIRSMMAVDFRRMFTMPFLYILLLISVIVPVLILVMTNAFADPADAASQAMMFTNAWQLVSSVGGTSGGMDMTSMCNMNLMYFMAAVLVCVNISQDFTCGYARNLFTVRPRKTDYIISKTVVFILAGIILMIGFFAGTMLGGAIAGLSLQPISASVFGAICCLIAKLLLMMVFVPIFVAAASLAKEKLWLSLILSLFIGMLLFMMVPMMTPLDAGIMNVMMCLAGGVLFSLLLGIGSVWILRHTDLT